MWGRGRGRGRQRQSTRAGAGAARHLFRATLPSPPCARARPLATLVSSDVGVRAHHRTPPPVGRSPLSPPRWPRPPPPIILAEHGEPHAALVPTREHTAASHGAMVYRTGAPVLYYTGILLYCLAFALERFSIGLAFAVYLYGEIAADLVLVAGNDGGVRGDPVPDACVAGVPRRFLPPPRQGRLFEPLRSRGEPDRLTGSSRFLAPARSRVKRATLALCRRSHADMRCAQWHAR